MRDEQAEEEATEVGDGVAEEVGLLGFGAVRGGHPDLEAVVFQLLGGQVGQVLHPNTELDVAIVLQLVDGVHEVVELGLLAGLEQEGEVAIGEAEAEEFAVFSGVHRIRRRWPAGGPAGPW